jgi:hypothetical protein
LRESRELSPGKYSAATDRFREISTMPPTVSSWPLWKAFHNGHYEKILFMESASVRARAAPWKAGSGSALKLCIKDTVS